MQKKYIFQSNLFFFIYIFFKNTDKQFENETKACFTLLDSQTKKKKINLPFSSVLLGAEITWRTYLGR